MVTKKSKSAKAAKPSKAAKNEMPTLRSKPNSAGPASSMAPSLRSSNAARSAVLHRTTAEISVSEQHSFELARTLMTATVSTVVSLREVFPRHRFAIRAYDCADPEVTYDAFMNGSGGRFAFERSEDTLNWKVLSRGTDDGAVNKLLDWIEIAATDALEKQYLAKLQLSFHAIDDAEVCDANLLEAYNICFTYENGQMHVGTAAGKNPAANSVVLRGAKTDLYTLVNDVALMIQERESLPADRRMNMMLLYNNTCPPDYEPYGFHANTDPNRLITQDKGAKIGSMNTGFHGLSVNLYQQNGQFSSKRGPLRLRSLSMSSEIDGGGTQEQGLRLFEGMGKYRDSRTQDTQLVSGIIQTSAGDPAPLISQNLTPDFLPYSQTVIERIDQSREKKGVVAHEDYDLDEATSPKPQVTCECGAFADESGLIQCDLCDEFKHIPCYGHLGSVPPAAKFACYSCLLDTEGALLSQVRATCVKRRALYYFLHHAALECVEDLAQYLDRDETITLGILGQLQLQGFVNRVTDHEKSRKGKGTSAEPLFKLVVDNQVVLGSIFRPELDIAHKLTDAQLLLPDSASPGSATISQTGNEELEQDTTMSTFPSVPMPTRDRDPVSAAQAARAEASSTEGTPSPRSILARRFSERQNLPAASNFRPVSFAASHLGRKRPIDATPERGFEQSVLHHRAKISAVNSPWTFRSTGM